MYFLVFLTDTVLQPIYIYNTMLSRTVNPLFSNLLFEHNKSPQAKELPVRAFCLTNEQAIWLRIDTELGNMIMRLVSQRVFVHTPEFQIHAGVSGQYRPSLVAGIDGDVHPDRIQFSDHSRQ